MKRQILSLLIAVFLVFSMIPLNAQAAIYGSCGNNVQWTFDNSSKRLTISGSGPMNNFDASMTTLPWYGYRTEIKTVVIQNGVTNIGEYAFYNTPQLQSVRIPASVTIINRSAFQNCTNLTGVTFESNSKLETIGYNAFSWCKLLNTITIPANVKTIDSFAFGYCDDLREIRFEGDAPTMAVNSFKSSNAYNFTRNAYYPINNNTWTDIASQNPEDGLKQYGSYLIWKSYCAHSWNSATCTTPKTCSICQKTEGNALGHSWDNACDATCNNNCGETRETTHTWVDATCENAKNCTICGQTEGSALGHNYENGTCSNCNDHVGAVIIQQPASVETPIGQKFSVSVAAEGEGLTYQWYYKDAGMKNFGVSSNKTSAYAYAMQSYMHNRQIYCVITDKDGYEVSTEVATLTRPSMELSILEQPKDVQTSVGQKFSVSPKVQGDGLVYQWYYKDAGMKNFGVSSNKSSAYAYTMQSYMHNRQVYCSITDQYGNNVVTDVATITRPPMEVEILSQPTDVYGAKGVKFSVNFQAQGDGLTYQWYYKESYQKNFSVSSNKTSAYAYAMQNYMDGRQVYCVVTDQYGNQVTTDTVTIHVTK